jgi:hypothetical protein
MALEADPSYSGRLVRDRRGANDLDRLATSLQRIRNDLRQLTAAMQPHGAALAPANEPSPIAPSNHQAVIVLNRSL